MKCNINLIKKIFVYLSLMIYTIFTFLKEHYKLNLGYWELLIIGFVGWLIRISISLNDENAHSFSNLLTPKSQRRFTEFLDIAESITSTMKSNLNNQSNPPFLTPTPIQTPRMIDDDIEMDNKSDESIYTIKILYPPVIENKVIYFLL
jgi:hypothetical protein